MNDNVELNAVVIEFFVRTFQDGAGRTPTKAEIAHRAHFNESEVEAGLRLLMDAGVMGSRDEDIYLVDAPLPAPRREDKLEYGLFVVEAGPDVRTFTAPLPA